MITLPVIIVLSHRWDLYFAVDRGTYIVSHASTTPTFCSMLTRTGYPTVP
jgi:hypothetical protein